MEDMQKIKSIKTIMVTNTKAYVAGSSMAAELAVMVAQNGKRVALIDADLRKPLVHSLFDLPNRVGLIDVLQGRRSLSAAMHKLDGRQLFVLTAGKREPAHVDVFATGKMIKLLEQVKRRYDKVIIHGPPFFYSETTTLAGLVDGVVMLIHPGHTKSETSSAIIEKIQKSGATLIGIVMREQPKLPTNQSAFIDRLLSYDRSVRFSHKN